jgi:hypothetical protein
MILVLPSSVTVNSIDLNQTLMSDMQESTLKYMNSMRLMLVKRFSFVVVFTVLEQQVKSSSSL